MTVSTEHLTGISEIDAQIRRTVETHELAPEAAKLLVLSGLNDKQIAAVAAYLKVVSIDIYLLLRTMRLPLQPFTGEKHS